MQLFVNNNSCCVQKYSNALSQSNTISQDTIHLLFPGLNKLLNFQRKFLIRLESTAEVSWKDQRWGLHFMENVSTRNSVLFPAIPLCFFRSLFPFLNNRKKSSPSTSRTARITPMQPNSCLLKNKVLWYVEFACDAPSFPPALGSGSKPFPRCTACSITRSSWRGDVAYISFFGNANQNLAWF